MADRINSELRGVSDTRSGHLQRRVPVVEFRRDSGHFDQASILFGTLHPFSRYRLDHQLGLKPKSLYRVRMTAKNKEAEGPPSQVVEFESAHSCECPLSDRPISSPALPIPTEVHATVTDDNSVVITFPAVRDPDDTTKTVQVLPPVPSDYGKVSDVQVGGGRG